MRPSACLAKMASTHCGMRRILKRQPPVTKYLRQAVETGVYKNEDTDGRGGRRPRDRPQRGRHDPGRSHDANEQFDYPIEYEILRMNPPVPSVPHIPRKEREEQAERMFLPTDRLIRSYLNRYDMRMRTAHPLTDSEREERMYARALGLSADREGGAGTDTAMGRKAAVLDHAYRFAMRQYDVLRKGEAGGMTEEESVSIVEELLSKEAREERSKSRRLAREAGRWREAKDQEERDKDEKEKGLSAHSTTEAEGTEVDREEPPASSSIATSTVPSILAGKPRTIRAMNMWSKRLTAVPYDQWTVGAAAALDHWIAVDVLGMSESSWKGVLRGDPGEDEEVMTGRLAEVGADHHSEGVGVGNAARAKDIVAVRSALFPETVLFSSGEDEEIGEGLFGAIAEEEQVEEADEMQKSIDKLLASLGEFEDEDFGVGDEEDGVADADAVHDAKVAQLMDELQEWRAKNVEVPHNDWSNKEKKDFSTWLNQYIAILTTDADGPVDLMATREALLSEPPVDRDRSDEFWSSVTDETEAEIYLQSLRERGMPPSADGEGSAADRQAQEHLRTFLSLPYERQLRKLVDMGTLRPVLDEYAKESERAEFLRRHAHSFMEGMEVEHLVPDPAGPVRAEDVGGGLLDSWEVKRGRRYRIEKIKYGSDEYGGGNSERARELWRAWNAHKAGRATYEEAMFKKGKIGLRDTTKAVSVKEKMQSSD